MVLFADSVYRVEQQGMSSIIIYKYQQKIAECDGICHTEKEAESLVNLLHFTFLEGVKSLLS